MGTECARAMKRIRNAAIGDTRRLECSKTYARKHYIGRRKESREDDDELVGVAGLGKDEAPADPRLQQAIERAVDKVEPRLKQAGGYPGSYRAVIGQALRYADQLAAAMPGRWKWTYALHARPLRAYPVRFAAPIQGTLCLSRAMQEYMRRPDAGTADIYALIGMRRNEKHTFAWRAKATCCVATWRSRPSRFPITP